MSVLVVRTEVTALDHEVLDNSVELGALVAETFLEYSAILLDTGSKSTEILNCLRDSLSKQVQHLFDSSAAHKNVHRRRDPLQLQVKPVSLSL